MPVPWAGVPAFIAVADDATAASHNPGGLIQLQQPELSIAGSYFLNLERYDQTGLPPLIADQHLDRFELNYLSVVYPFQFLRRNITLSLNFQRLYNLEGDSDLAAFLNPNDCACAAVQRVRSHQTGQLFTFSPAMAVQITPAFSIGLAANIWPNLFGNGWEQDIEVASEGTISSGNRVVPFTSLGKIRETFTFEGINFTLGFFWTLNSIFTFTTGHI